MSDFFDARILKCKICGTPFASCEGMQCDCLERKKQAELKDQMKYKCPGIEIKPTVFSGCDAIYRAGEADDCPVCGGTGYIENCPVCGEPTRWNQTCKNGCWYPLNEGEE